MNTKQRQHVAHGEMKKAGISFAFSEQIVIFAEDNKHIWDGKMPNCML